MKVIWFISWLLPFLTFYQDLEWKEQKSKDGITVYTKKFASGYKATRALVTINSSPTEIYKIITEYENLPNWLYQIASSEILNDDPLSTVYYTVNTPFPVKNRDLVLRNETEYLEDGMIKINFKAVPDIYPISKKHVRIDIVEGYWLLTPKEDGKTEVVHYSYTEPTGVPSWLLNTFISNAPLHNMSELRKIAEKSN